MSTITSLVKELASQPVTPETETLFSERTKTLIHRIAEKCRNTKSPLDEYMCGRRAEDLLIYLVRECSRCQPEIYIEMLARIIVPMIENKLEWEEESEKLLAGHAGQNKSLLLETDIEDIPVFPAAAGEQGQAAGKLPCGTGAGNIFRSAGSCH